MHFSDSIESERMFSGMIDCFGFEDSNRDEDVRLRVMVTHADAKVQRFPDRPQRLIDDVNGLDSTRDTMVERRLL